MNVRKLRMAIVGWAVLLGAFVLATTNPLQAQFREVVESQGVTQGPVGLEPLVHVITTTVSPDSWDEVGGPGTIDAVDGWGLMIVSQTDDVHDKIADLIEVLRRARRTQVPAATADQKNSGAAKATTPLSLVAENERAMMVRKRIMASLADETTLEFVDSPLSEVAEFLKQKHKVPVFIDTKALEEVGMGADTPVTINVKGVSLRSGLRLLLGQLGLTTMIKDDVLKITTPEHAEFELITRVYPVQDLSIAPPPKKSGTTADSHDAKNKSGH